MNVAVIVDPIEQVRDQIEHTAQRGDLTDGERTAIFRNLRERLNDLLGVLGRYELDEDRVQEARRLDGWLTEEQARTRATLRQELIDRNVATSDELEAMGYLSHEELDKLVEEGLLEEALAGTLAYGVRQWEERLHPRGRGGMFADKPGSTPLKNNLRSKKPPPEPLLDRPKAAPRKPKAKPKDKSGDLTAKGFDRRKKGLERRTREEVGKAASANFTEGEAHFNDAGKVSQRTLSQYVDRAATQPKTVDLYSEVDGEGNRVWDESRRELHEQIIDRFMRHRVFDPGANSGEGGWVFSADAPYFEPQETPEVLFSGGGYAAGKGSVLKLNRAKGSEPESGYEGPVMVLDPDLIKNELPEFYENLGSDPEVNMRVYEEAWAISQEIQARAQEKKLNLVVDGISNTSPEEMIERARTFIDQGYTAKAIYVDIPTEEALRRAAERARKAKSDADRRHIPEIILRSVHRDVAATVPNMVRRLREENIPLEVEVWDNDQGQTVEAGFLPPVRFFYYKDGEEQVEDKALWDNFVNKAHETILGVDAPAKEPKKQRDAFEMAVDQTRENQRQAEENAGVRDAQIAYNPTVAELNAAETSGDPKRIAAARKAEEEAREKLHAAILAAEKKKRT